MEKLFPCITASLNILAAIVYLWKGDYARMTYWLAAAVLTATITWWIK